MKPPAARAAAPPRSRLAAVERRSLVTAAAASLFAERGYAGTSLEEIATAAGVTKPIVYRHFSSKKALYLALLRKHRDDLPGFVVSASPGAPAPELREILAVWFAYARANAHGWRMLFRDASGDAEIVRFRLEVQAKARAVLVTYLERAGGGAIPAAELEPTAEIIRAGLAGLILWWTEHPDVRQPDLLAAAERLIAPLLAGR